MRVYLIDIDGTLLLTGGAGFAALEQTFQELFGVRGAMRTVKPAGQISSRTGEVCRPCKRGGERRMRADAAAYVDITEDLLPMMSSVFALEIVHEAETAEVETAEVEADEVETE